MFKKERHVFPSEMLRAPNYEFGPLAPFCPGHWPNRGRGTPRALISDQRGQVLAPLCMAGKSFSETQIVAPASPDFLHQNLRTVVLAPLSYSGTPAWLVRKPSGATFMRRARRPAIVYAAQLFPDRQLTGSSFLLAPTPKDTREKVDRGSAKSLSAPPSHH